MDFSHYTMAKFIPASGAASRMFKDLYAFVEDGVATEFVENFFENLENFAFYDELSQHIDGLDKNHPFDRVKIVKQLLNDQMNYGNLPKALLTFHEYENETTTPIDEQILEGELTLNPEQVNLHFTVSEEHEDLFNAYVDEVTRGKEQIQITYSFQKNETDTLAVDLENKPFVLENGEVLYRPGGHGALLSNLNDMDEDIIFIKNIDNVVHQSQLDETIESKKQLAAVGVQVKEKLDAYLEALVSREFDLDEIGVFIEETLNIRLKNLLTREKAIELLNRPLRVCGVVKNEGEPGGGPYIVDNGEYSDLQICEKAEIDLNDAQQVEILNTSEFFNPVDLVCFTKDYQGEKFNLMDYTNEDRYFISDKTHEGRPLKALEHPGLWNGAMHNWNTLFVEVPLSTFNPVKTVNDLLKAGHREQVEVLNR